MKSEKSMCFCFLIGFLRSLNYWILHSSLFTLHFKKLLDSSLFTLHFSLNLALHSSLFTPPSCFPSSSRLQSFHRSATCVNPLQELRLNNANRGFLLYQLKQRRATEGTRTKIKAEVSTCVKASLRLRHLWNGRKKTLDRRKVRP